MPREAKDLIDDKDDDSHLAYEFSDLDADIEIPAAGSNNVDLDNLWDFGDDEGDDEPTVTLPDNKGRGAKIEFVDDGSDDDDDERRTTDADDDDPDAALDRLPMSAKERLAAERARLEEHERGIVERDEEIRQLRARNAAGDRAFVEMSVRHFEGLLTSQQQQLEAAIESGDTKAQAKLHTDIASTSARLANAQAAKDRLGPAGEDGNAAPDRGRSNTPAVAPNPERDAWKQRNGWYGSNAAAAGAAQALERALYSEGRLHPTSRAYWDELDRRMKAAMPAVYGDDQEARRGRTDREEERPARETRGRRRVRSGGSPTAGVTRPGSGDGDKPTARGKTRVKMDRFDHFNMKTFGFDPDDPNDVRDYAVEAVLPRQRRSRGMIAR